MAGPLHVPGVIDTWSPTFAPVAATFGSDRHRGPAGSTIVVGSDAAWTDPSMFVAVTITTRVWPTSAALGV